MKFTVNLKVEARMRVEIDDAANINEAIEKANDIMSEADCGPLHDIDWNTHSVEDENGNVIHNEPED